MNFRYYPLEAALHELVSLFMQEVWMERLIPRQFLSFLLCQGESGYPVAKSLNQVLGGKKVVETWLLDEKTDGCSFDLMNTFSPFPVNNIKLYSRREPNIWQTRVHRIM